MRRLPLWSAAGFLLVASILFVLRGGEVADSLAGVPVWAALLAPAAQLGWLVCRGTAWRLSVGAAQRHLVPAAAAHSANALAFLVGIIQQAATVPVRAVALRRMAPDQSPPLELVLVADAPVLALEGTVMGFLLLVAGLVSNDVPSWVPAASLGGALALLIGLFAARETFHERGLTRGLHVLADRRRGPALAGLAIVMSGLALTRSWAVLAGLGLPHGFESTVLFLAALGVLGALPIGPTASPAAALAVFGSIDATKAASAGVAMTATTLIAVTIYGLVSLAAFSLRGGGSRAALEAGTP